MMPDSFPSLCSYNRLGVGKVGEPLVSLCWEQKPLQVAPKTFTLSPDAEEIVEAASVAFQRIGSGPYGQSSGHAASPPPYAAIGAQPLFYFNKLPPG